MSMYITLTEKEILETPNDSSLGELVRNKYWEHKERKMFSSDIKKAWICSICGKDTSEVDGDYLFGWDHLSCKLEKEISDEKDKCVICGKETPYTINTNINQRIGYVEGGGQGCFQPNICEK